MSIGIDASADSVAICVIDWAGSVIAQCECSSSPPEVIEYLENIYSTEPYIIGIEAGSTGTFLTRKLRDKGYDIRVLETRSVAAFLQLTQNKTDRNDAKGIAEIVRLGTSVVPDVLVKPEAIQRLRSELTLRHRLMKQRLAVESALKALFRLNGGKLGRAFSGTHLDRNVQAELERLRTEGNDLSDLVTPILEINVALRRMLEKSDRRLQHTAEDIDVCRRFMTIPGVGSICALSFYTAIADPKRFVDSGDVGPYLGLVPKISQSGQSFYRGRITRRGSTMTRTHLVSAAKSLMQQADKDCALRRWTLRLADRAGRGKARVALARKLAVVMLAMWKTGGSFEAEPS